MTTAQTAILDHLATNGPTTLADLQAALGLKRPQYLRAPLDVLVTKGLATITDGTAAIAAQPDTTTPDAPLYDPTTTVKTQKLGADYIHSVATAIADANIASLWPGRSAGRLVIRDEWTKKRVYVRHNGDGYAVGAAITDLLADTADAPRPGLTA